MGEAESADPKSRSKPWRNTTHTVTFGFLSYLYVPE